MTVNGDDDRTEEEEYQEEDNDEDDKVENYKYLEMEFIRLAKVNLLT